jgi:hypothetical protein
MKAFAPESVFLGSSTQAEVYAAFAEGIVRGVLAGTNGCLTAYGQTGSGKTHTMLGDPTSPAQAGIIPRALHTLFGGIAALTAEAEGKGQRVSASLKASYVEVYQENVYDLLAKREGAGAGTGWVGGAGSTGGALIPGVQRLLKLRGDDSSGFFLEGVTETLLVDTDQALDVLAQGFAARRTANTAMNSRSSRSHALLSITVSIRAVDLPVAAGEEGPVERVLEREATLDVVDLAGSERQRDTGAEGSALREAGKINNSLSHLAEVIKTLLENGMVKHSKASRPVPWRNSKLTMLLRRSLAGNSRTAMIFAISPAVEYWSESINTLQFADRARKLKTEPSRNERTILMGGTAAQLGVLNKELDTAKALIARLTAALAAGAGGGAGEDVAALLAEGSTIRSLDFSLPSAGGAAAYAQLTGNAAAALACLTERRGQAGVVASVVADALVLRAALVAMGEPSLPSAARAAASALLAVLNEVRNGLGGTAPQGEGEGRRSPKLARRCGETDTAAARCREQGEEEAGSPLAGSEEGSSFDGSGMLGEGRFTDAYAEPATRAAMAAAVAAAAPPSDAGAGPGSETSFMHAVMAGVRASLLPSLAAGRSAALASSLASLGLPCTAQPEGVLLLLSQEAEVVMAALSAPSAARPPAQAEEVPFSRAHAAARRPVETAASAPLRALLGNVTAPAGPVPAPALPARARAPSLAALGLFGAEGDARARDPLFRAAKAAAERMSLDPSAQPRVDHLAPAEISRLAMARARASSISSVSSGVGRYRLEVEVRGAEGGGGREEGEEEEGAVVVGEATLGLFRTCEGEVGGGAGYVDADEEDEARREEEGEGGDLAGLDEEGMDGAPSARTSGVSTASSSASIGTSISAKIERANALHMSQRGGGLREALSLDATMSEPARSAPPRPAVTAESAMAELGLPCRPAYAPSAPVPSLKPLPTLAAFIRSVPVPAAPPAPPAPVAAAVAEAPKAKASGPTPAHLARILARPARGAAVVPRAITPSLRAAAPVAAPPAPAPVEAPPAPPVEAPKGLARLIKTVNNNPKK